MIRRKENFEFPQSKDQALLYRSLGDLLAIHWEFHKWKMVDENLKPKTAGQVYFSLPSPHAVDLRQNAHSGISADYLSHTRTAIQGSLVESFGAFYGKKEVVHPADVLAVDPFTRNLVAQIEEKNDHAKTVALQKNILKGIEMGFTNAVGVALYMVVGYASREIPLVDQAVQNASKIALHHLDDLKHSIGYTPAGIRDDDVATVAFDALGPTGVSREALVAFGLGKTLGCPASYRPSPSCLTFLESHGCKPSSNVVRELTQVIAQTWNEKVLPWYSGLREGQKMRYFHPATRNFIEAKIDAKK